MINYLQNKIIWLGGFLIAFTAPIQELMIATGVIILIDFIFGISAAVKNKVPITSKRMSNTVTKLIAYNLLIISAYLMQLYFLKRLPVVEMTTGFIGVIELLSIGENFSKLTGHNFISYIKKIIISKMKPVELDAISEELQNENK